MSYGKLNIWLRDLNCCPKNVWKVDLVVKTCGGEYLVDFNPDVIDKLKEAYPDYNVQRGTMNHETTIRITQPPTPSTSHKTHRSGGSTGLLYCAGMGLLG